MTEVNIKLENDDDISASVDTNIAWIELNFGQITISIPSCNWDSLHKAVHQVGTRIDIAAHITAQKYKNWYKTVKEE